VVFGIGIFPYLALAFSLFFFDAATVNRLFLKSKPLYTGNEVRIPRYGSLGVLVFVTYLLIHIALPLRHYFFEDNVLWT
jgi:vitamin K-dependent gamma-carboxylase